MSGSTEGGLSLTIYGNYFDDREPYVAPRAYVGGENFFCIGWRSLCLFYPGLTYLLIMRSKVAR